MPEPGPPRRTQAERTAETIANLLDATIASIVEVGYARTTTREISARARISQGGLFRHFPSRRDLILRAATRLHEKRVAAVQTAALDGELRTTIRAVQSAARQPVEVVWIELTVAARTDPELAAGLQPLLDDQRRAFRDAAESDPAFARLPEAAKVVWLGIADDVLTALTIRRDLVAQPELDEIRTTALLALVESLADS